MPKRRPSKRFARAGWRSNADTYSTDTWSFTGTANYNNIASTTITDSIAKVNATVVVTPYSVDYNGLSHTATYTITGVNGQTGATVGSVDVSNTMHTVVGTYASDSWSFTGTANYNNIAATTITDVIAARSALVNYIGQTQWVTSGTSSTTAQVTLTASMQDPTGIGLAGATVDFIDCASGKVLASGVKVSQVAGSPANTGTANTVVTLSSGQYGAESYVILVKLTGCYKNTDQTLADKTATVIVSKLAGTNEICGGGTIANMSTSAGTYRSDISSEDVTYSIGMKYTKSGTNPQGKITLAIPQTDGSIVYIKSNSISSMSVTGTPDKTATIYTKATIYKVLNDGSVVSIDANVTLRMDIVEYANPTMKDQVGFTVLSTKDSSLYYSNNWSRVGNVWKTQTQDADKDATINTYGYAYKIEGAITIG